MLAEVVSSADLKLIDEGKWEVYQKADIPSGISHLNMEQKYMLTTAPQRKFKAQLQSLPLFCKFSPKIWQPI